MIQQVQHPCNECKGTGQTINDKDRCPQCKGEKVVQEKKVMEVFVEKGMQNGQKITFPGEADEAPDTITGDIVFVLQQKDHPKFKRKGDDLFVWLPVCTYSSRWSTTSNQVKPQGGCEARFLQGNQ
ncbi:hypothetical protein REPUB_Repub10bG0088400 [Reevesia pubescens]